MGFTHGCQKSRKTFFVCMCVWLGLGTDLRYCLSPAQGLRVSAQRSAALVYLPRVCAVPRSLRWSLHGAHWTGKESCEDLPLSHDNL